MDMAGKQTKLAKLLKDARVAVGFSQTKAAQLLGVERQTVGAWERGATSYTAAVSVDCHSPQKNLSTPAILCC